MNTPRVNLPELCRALGRLFLSSESLRAASGFYKFIWVGFLTIRDFFQLGRNSASSHNVPFCASTAWRVSAGVGNVQAKASAGCRTRLITAECWCKGYSNAVTGQVHSTTTKQLLDRHEKGVFIYGSAAVLIDEGGVWEVNDLLQWKVNMRQYKLFFGGVLAVSALFTTWKEVFSLLSLIFSWILPPVNMTSLGQIQWNLFHQVQSGRKGTQPEVGNSKAFY